MNTPEKYVAAYIVESLTGIQGSNPERVHEVLRNSDFTIDDPFLRLVYDVARFNPDAQEAKDLVASLVVAQTITSNSKIAEALEATIENLAEKRAKKKEEKKEVVISYNVDGGLAYFTVLASKGDKILLESSIVVPEQLKGYVIEKFLERFPDGKVVEE